MKHGIILLNMGGPSSLDDVHPFLYNLFSDRQIIKLGPALLQKPIAWYIAHKRAPKSKEMYRRIGGGSPLNAITHDQARALQSALADRGDFVVTVAMRYLPPYGEEALQILLDHGVNDITALSLYPHFSRATTGSSIQQLNKAYKKLNAAIPLQTISSWPNQPSYIQALADNILAGLRSFTDEKTTIVYSAHSLPVSFITTGDPYVDHIKDTIRSLEKIIGQEGSLCFQSRSGPVEWLSPSTPETIQSLAEKGCKNILMVPISFVSDHVETLYEINILYKKQAAELGMRLEQCQSLNTNPLFIQGLKELVTPGNNGYEHSSKCPIPPR